MSVYMRGHGKCFRWTDLGTWVECLIDEPETRERKKDAQGKSIEGMIIGPWEGMEDSLQGPLTMGVQDFLSLAKEKL